MRFRPTHAAATVGIAVLLTSGVAGCGGSAAYGAGACNMISLQTISATFGKPAGAGWGDNQPDSTGYYGCEWEPEPGYQDPVMTINLGFESTQDFSKDRATGGQTVVGLGNAAFLAPGEYGATPSLEVQTSETQFFINVDLAGTKPVATNVSDERTLAADVLAYLSSQS